MNEKYHEMILENTHISGMEEWYCPTCGRRIVIQWPPAHRVILREAGDEDTRHNLSKVHSRMGAQVTQTEELEPIEQFRLMPWLKWMEEVDFDSRWDKSD